MKQSTRKLGKRVPGHLSGYLQIFEIKQMADMEALYKGQCRQALRDYKAWRQKYGSETDMIELLYGNLEGIMLRRRAEDAVRLYGVIRQDFRSAFKEYLAKNCCYPSAYIKSKAA